MTLQQKLLAKQSKKGFTLVELVVVIAILGILAAIAIPAVIGIINSAHQSQQKTDAASLSNACKDMYAEVVSGTLNSSSPKAINGLPAANAPASTKKTTALGLTVQHAINYAGLEQLEGKVGDFVYDTATGTIYGKDDEGKPSSASSTVTLGTTMQDLGYK